MPLELLQNLPADRPQRLLATVVATHVEAQGQPQGTPMGEHSLPTEAVVVGDLDPPAQRWSELPESLPLELCSGLVRERDNQDLGVRGRELSGQIASQPDGQARLPCPRWREDDLVTRP